MMDELDVIEVEVWYPVWKLELYQTIDDCDVIERYQGYIKNSRTGRTKQVEDLGDAKRICAERNAKLEGK
jgi:hypothetical protein